jgi:predicted nucleotidyltransferase component of viral defense system
LRLFHTHDPQRNLSLLANRLHREHGGRRIPESELERDYCLAWFLVGLSQSRLGQLLIFKGGTALSPPHSLQLDNHSFVLLDKIIDLATDADKPLSGTGKAALHYLAGA